MLPSPSDSVMGKMTCVRGCSCMLSWWYTEGSKWMTNSPKCQPPWTGWINADTCRVQYPHRYRKSGKELVCPDMRDVSEKGGMQSVHHALALIFKKEGEHIHISTCIFKKEWKWDKIQQKGAIYRRKNMIGRDLAWQLDLSEYTKFCCFIIESM